MRYGSTELEGFDKKVWSKEGYNSFGLKVGQWTDDASMGLCIAESLIACKGFNAHDLRLRFLNWWELGYCNAFGKDTGRKSSVGLGGNISLSFSEFTKNKTEYTTAGDKYTSGNGSIMRMSAVPVFFHDDIEKAMEFSSKQSKTTHQGDEASECCRLMTFLIVNSFQSKEFSKQQVLDFCSSFQSNFYSIKCLANSLQEERTPENEKLKLEDRNWNWKDDNFKFSPNRSVQQPGYIGSYCMDALSMSLHCIHSTNNFKDACLKAANLRGDSDSVCAVTAQLAGAIYGLRGIPKEWLQCISTWDDGLIGLRAYKLFTKNPPSSPSNNPPSSPSNNPPSSPSNDSSN